MKRFYLILLCCCVVSVVSGQIQRLEDYVDIYRPDSDLLLTGILPTGFVRVDRAQAVPIIDTFFMEMSGTKTSSKSTPNVAYYKRGNVVITSSILQDSIRWQIQQDLLVQVQIPQDPSQPQVVLPSSRPYDNPYNTLRNSSGVMHYLIRIFNLRDYYGNIWSGMTHDMRTANTLHIGYAYPVSSPMWLYPVLLAFDKDFHYNVEIRVYTVNSQRQEAVDIIQWIANNMEIREELLE